MKLNNTFIGCEFYKLWFMLSLGGDDRLIVNVMLTCQELCNSLVQHKESSFGIIICIAWLKLKLRPKISHHIKANFVNLLVSIISNKLLRIRSTYFINFFLFFSFGRFGGVSKNFRLYYDGLHYVGKWNGTCTRLNLVCFFFFWIEGTVV